jgi:NADPH:quinone reductase-like Zn-dependent oxidoreductase
MRVECPRAGAEVWLSDLPVPGVTEGTMLVRVRAAALNAIDSALGPGRPAGPGDPAVAGYRRPGHLVEGGHIGSGHRACGLSVAQTSAGVLASGAQGVPVVVVQPPADAEVAGIADPGVMHRGAR